ncbi:hypothetical protein PR003_g12295 [Phytophthora rubi]|uniref:Uncharacterized protein n=1 Tax=Phytophthora rubi TaxID=129364 RepID=A0A6A4F8S8_9STRA|nr:hypothetical protein PR003_g12295 [Phytophthora rubi]
MKSAKTPQRPTTSRQLEDILSGGGGAAAAATGRGHVRGASDE